MEDPEEKSVEDLFVEQETAAIQEEVNSQILSGQPNASEPQDDEPQRDDVPPIIADLIEHFQGIYVPTGVDEASQPYDRMLKGRCVACAAPLGSDTIAFVTKHGVTMLFCSGVCTNDYQIMGWMSEVYDDLTQKMQFRGGNNG